MAEQSEDNEKTEDPTQKRLDEALERGDVAKKPGSLHLVRAGRRDIDVADLRQLRWH